MSLLQKSKKIGFNGLLHLDDVLEILRSLDDEELCSDEPELHKIFSSCVSGGNLNKVRFEEKYTEYLVDKYNYYKDKKNEINKRTEKAYLICSNYWLRKLYEDIDLKIRDTHFLTLIPKTVNGLAYNIDLGDKLLENSINMKYKIDENDFPYGSHYNKYIDREKETVDKSYWVLMPKWGFPGTTFASDEEGFDFDNLKMKAIFGYYVFPNSLELTTVLITNYVRTGECFLSQDESYFGVISVRKFF